MWVIFIEILGKIEKYIPVPSGGNFFNCYHAALLQILYILRYIPDSTSISRPAYIPFKILYTILSEITAKMWGKSGMIKLSPPLSNIRTKGVRR
jgi:hypothetical protein